MIQSKKKIVLKQGENYTVYFKRTGLQAPTLRAIESIEFKENELDVCKTLSATKIRYAYYYEEPYPIYRGYEVYCMCFWKDRT